MSDEVSWSIPGPFVPADFSGKLDARNVYVYRARKLAASSKPGIERFAMNLFGPDFMGSLAFALDPYRQIKIPTAIITQANRLRSLQCTFPRTRSYHRYAVLKEIHNSTDPSTPELDTTPMQTDYTTTDHGTTTCLSQDALFGSLSDTTIRTRPPGSPGGTFELWAPWVSSPPRVSVYHTRVCTRQDYFGWPLMIDQTTSHVAEGHGPGLRWTKSSVDALKGPEQAFASSMMQKNALRLINSTLPTRKHFQFFYNVAELKDLPLLLRNAVELYANPIDSLTTFRGAGNQYLNYQFGWLSVYQAVSKMLSLPQKISKQVNYLISRNGKDTTYRSGFKTLDSLSSAPLFTYDRMNLDETFVTAGVSNTRKWALRCVLNYKIVLPKIELPILRRDLLEKSWGMQPRPIDVYNLVPWTWLVDWFSGLGDYIQILDTLYSDQSLFNYGYLTYSSECKITGTLRMRTTDTESIQDYPAPRQHWSTTSDHRYSGVLGYRYQSRIDISTIPYVKTISRPTSLSDDQKAIIGALLTKFAKS